MLDKIWLLALEEFGKLIDFSECLSNFESETYRTGVRATTYLLICMMGFMSAERKHDTFNTR
jgi:hypothetical protein